MADDIRVQKILHKGKHVASVHTYRGRAGGSVSQAHNPDGSEATKKYGIGMNDTKKDIVKKIKQHHKGMTEEAKATYCGRCGTTHVPPSKGGKCPALKEDNVKTLTQFVEESTVILSEGEQIKAHHERVKKLKGKQVSFTHPTSKQKITGTMQKVVHMGGLPYAHVETGKSAHRVPVHQIH